MTITNIQQRQHHKPGVSIGKIVLTALLGALLLSGCASTPTQDIEVAESERRELFDQAGQAYRKFDYSRAIELLDALARQGYDDAQYALGYMYYYGFGVTQDENLAIAWIKRAAASGHTRAITALDRIQVVRDYEQKKKQNTEPRPDKHSLNKPAGGADLHTRMMLQAETIEPEPGPEPDQTVLPTTEELPPAAVTITAEKRDSAATPEQQTAIRTEPATANKTDDALASDTQGLQWLKQQNPEHYTIQLVSGSKEQRIRRYITAHGLTAQTTLVTLQRVDEAPVHIALYGIYPSVTEASRAMEDLPEPIQEAQPWVRGIGQVLAELK